MLEVTWGNKGREEGQKIKKWGDVIYEWSPTKMIKAYYCLVFFLIFKNIPILFLPFVSD